MQPFSWAHTQAKIIFTFSISLPLFYYLSSLNYQMLFDWICPLKRNILNIIDVDREQVKSSNLEGMEEVQEVEDKDEDQYQYDEEDEDEDIDHDDNDEEEDEEKEDEAKSMPKREEKKQKCAVPNLKSEYQFLLIFACN